GGGGVGMESGGADGHYDGLPAWAAALVGRHVTLMVAQGGDPPVLAAKSATATIPIVFTISSDPVRLGIVASLNRPAGNVTGFWPYTSLLGTKRLELMQQLLPANAPIAVLVNPENPNSDLDVTELQKAARTLGKPITLLKQTR